MVNQKSFSEVVKSLRERKKFERESEVKASEAKCKYCKGKISINGPSKIFGICNSCVSLSLTDNLKPKGL